MSDQPDNLVLSLLRAIRNDVMEIRADLLEVKQRLTTLEIQVGNLVATEQSHYAQLMLRMDRHEARLDRIERRLDLTADAPSSVRRGHGLRPTKPRRRGAGRYLARHHLPDQPHDNSTKISAAAARGSSPVTH